MHHDEQQHLPGSNKDHFSAGISDGGGDSSRPPSALLLPNAEMEDASAIRRGSPAEYPSRRLPRGYSAVVILAFTIVLLEGFLRVLGVANPILYEEDPLAGYRLQPNQVARYLNNDIVINGWGVRDSRALREKPAGVKRILVLGDSVTWGGVQIPQPKLFTSVLERNLPNTEIINAGINGYSAAQMARHFQSTIPNLESDFVVLVAIPRDFTRQPVVRLLGTSAAFPLSKPSFALPTAIEAARIAMGRKLGINWMIPRPETAPLGPILGDSDCLDQNTREVADLAHLVGGAKHFVVVFAPVLPGSPAAGPLASTKERLSAQKVAFFDLGTRIVARPDIFVDGVHLNIEGHQRVGIELASYLRPLLIDLKSKNND